MSVQRERERGRRRLPICCASRRRHRGAVIASSASGHITFTLLLKIHFPDCDSDCGIDCKRFAISITRDAIWRRRRLLFTLLFTFCLAAIDLSTEVDLCNRYGERDLPESCAISIAISGGFVCSELPRSLSLSLSVDLTLIQASVLHGADQSLITV